MVNEITGDTILHRAIFHRKENIIGQLLKMEGVDINASDRDGVTPLCVAVSGGQISTVVKFLHCPNIIIDIGDSINEIPCIHFAIAGNYPDIATEMVNSGLCDINKQDKYGVTDLHAAAVNGYKEIVRILIKHRDVNIDCADENGETALMYAFSAQEYDIAKILMSTAGVNFKEENNVGSSLLHFAMLHKKGDKIIVNALLDRGLDVNKSLPSGHTPLHIAAARGFRAGVEALLLDPYIKVNLRDGNSLTPQLTAKLYHHDAIAQLFQRKTRQKVMTAEEFLYTLKRHGQLARAISMMLLPFPGMGYLL
ncbi:ankyrin repeat domain-containing protein [Acerihabitans arboris]|nr:ankyrin repeat domain-containing protein [Acerihabitans arboris]